MHTDYASNFDGQRFHNVPDRPQAGIRDVIKWMLARDLEAWEEPPSDPEPGDAPPAHVTDGEARVTFVNHSTVLIQTDRVNILTDPIYAERASPMSWAGPRRIRPPGIDFDDLPTLDAVLLSHNHYDHTCLDTLGRIIDRDEPAIYAGLGNGRLLEGAGLGAVTEMDWWQCESVARGLSVTYVPAQHFSGRGIFDRCKTLWGGFVIRGKGIRIYFAGDTGEGPHFEEIKDRLGPPDLALLPIGAYRPRVIMKPVHLSPAEAVAAHRQLGARRSMAIHFGTFPLADDGPRESAAELHRVLTEVGLSPDDFWVLDFGEGRDVPSHDVSIRSTERPP